MKTVNLECGCEIEWKEWGGPGQEDFPWIGRVAWCNAHGDQEIEDLDETDYNTFNEQTIIISGDGGSQTGAGKSGMAYAAGSRLHIWQQPDSDGSVDWWYCFSGVSEDGNAYESDDVGPFATAEEARETAMEYIES